MPLQFFMAEAGNGTIGNNSSSSSSSSSSTFVLQPVSIAGAACTKYLQHERALYMQRNPDWRRARDRLADAAWHQAAAKMVERTGRKMAPHIEITIDRDWLLLLDEACLGRARFSDGIFSIAINTVAEMEGMMGDMSEEGELWS